MLWLLGGVDLHGGISIGHGFAVAGRAQAFLGVVIVGAVTAVVYLAAAALLRVPELADLVGPVRRLIRRR